MKRTGKTAWAWIAGVLAIGLGVVAYYGYGVYDEFQEHSGRDLAALTDLPAGASHIYFRRNHGYRCFIFNIDEAGFRTWVAERGMVDKRVYARDNSHLHFFIDKGLDIDADVTDGIVIQNDDLTLGRTYWVVYDRMNHRAYYEWMRD